MLDFVAHYLLFLSHSVTLTLSDLDLEKMAIIQNLDFPSKIFKVKVTCYEGHQIRKEMVPKVSLYNEVSCVPVLICRFLSAKGRFFYILIGNLVLLIGPISIYWTCMTLT